MVEENTLQNNSEKNSSNGNKPENLSPIERAEQAAERFKQENDRRERLLREEQELRANDMLSGRAVQSPVQEQIKAESNQDYVKKVMTGEIKYT